MAKLMHLALIGLLCLCGILMAVAMIPLIALILLGMLVFAIAGGRNPRELTRKTALASNGFEPR